MLKRLYADNYSCLVNFELNLDRVNLLLGDNGTGKSSVFEVLHRLQQFLGGNAKVLAVFPSGELTRWQTNSTQRFELDLQVGEANYAYSLLIEHDEDRREETPPSHARVPPMPVRCRCQFAAGPGHVSPGRVPSAVTDRDPDS